MRIRFSLLHFGRRPPVTPVVPSTNHIHPLPPPDNSVQLGPPDRRSVLSQWQYLGSLDPNSRDYVELLRTLVDIESNRNVALKFTNDDAGVVINAIAEVSSCDIIGCNSHAAYVWVLPLNVRLSEVVGFKANSLVTPSQCFVNSPQTMAESQTFIWLAKALIIRSRNSRSQVVDLRKFGRGN